MARTRKPSALSRSYSFFSSSMCGWSIGRQLAVELEGSCSCGKIASGAPLEMMRSLPSGVRTTTDMMRRWKSKGISSTLVNFGNAGVGVGLLVRQNRAVEDVLQAGLEVAVHVGQREHAFVSRAAPRRSASPG